MMKLAALGFSLFLAATASPAQARESLPVATMDGRVLELRSVTALRRDDAVYASGWVRLRTGHYVYAPAHLHVEALNADGEVLQTIETRWQGDPSSRVHARRAALFRTEFDPALSATIASVRISIENGPRHAAE